MSAQRWLLAGLCVFGLLVVGCPKKAAPETKLAEENKSEEAEKGSREEHEHEELPKRVSLEPEVIAEARVTTTPATREALALTIALPGEIAADPDKSARIASPIAGRIERVAFREGSPVKKGDPLATVRVPDLGKLRSTLSATLAKGKAARANAERLKGLVEKRLASEQSHLDAVAEADALDVEARAAGEQLAALGMGAEGGSSPSQLTLRAPVAGTVVSRDAVVGQPVTAEEVIAQIVDLSELWFLGRVFEKDLGKLKLGAEVEVQLNAYPDERFSGAVEYIGQQVDPVARTVTARVRLKNRDNLLRVGLFGSAYVSTEHSNQESIVIPRSAVTEVAGKPVAFVRRRETEFELHELTLGDGAGGKVQVVAGLHEGEQVVTEGVFTLKSAVLKATFAEEEE